MRRFWIALSVLVSLVAAFAFVGSALADHEDDKHPAPPPRPQSVAFQAVLTGRGEVPPTTSTGVGIATFLLSQDGATLFYTVQVTGATSAISAAHIHLGHPGQNGDIVANLCAGNCTTEGITASGSITSASLVGPLAGHPLSDLLSAIRANNAYSNVHTANFPSGELRGQVRPLGAVAAAVRDAQDDEHDDHGDHDNNDSDS